MRLAVALVLLMACGSRDTSDLERRLAALEASAGDTGGQWWCVGASCKRIQAECEALRGSAHADMRCARRRVAFCMQANLCFSSLQECHRFAVNTASRAEACAGVE